MAGSEPETVLERLTRQGFKLFEIGERELRPVVELSRLIDELSGTRFTNLFAKR
jgi:hypothetical protein